MPRRNKNAREQPKPKRVKTKTNIRYLPRKYDGIGPGRVVYVAEWVEEDRRAPNE